MWFKYDLIRVMKHVTEPMAEKLRDLGLNKNEALVYLALASMGKTKAGEVIERSGMHRNLVYTALDTLAEKNLVTKSTNGSVSFFQASDPERLLDILHEQELTAKRLVEEIKRTQHVAAQDIQVFEGEGAVRQFWLSLAEALQPKESLRVIGSGGKKFQDLMGDAMKKYTRLLDRSLGAHVIMHPEQSITDREYAQAIQEGNVQVKFIQTQTPPLATIAFTDHVVIFALYSAEPVIIQIKSPDLVSVYRNYFDVLWNQTVRVDVGWKAMEASYAQMLQDLRPDETYYVLGASEGLDAKRYADFYDRFHAQRVEKNVCVNMLSYQVFTESIRKRFVRVGDSELKISRIRSMPGIPMGIMEVRLFRNRVVFEVHAQEPTIITIDDPQVFVGMKQYFDDYWKQAA